MRRACFFLAWLVVVPTSGLAACAAFDGGDGGGVGANDASSGGPDGSSGASSSGSTSSSGGRDAGGAETSSGGTPDGGLDCSGALVCDDFERSEIQDGTHPYLATIDHGTIGIVNGVLDAVLEASTLSGNGPLAIVEQHPPSDRVPKGAVIASVDLDLELVERGASSNGFTNIVSVDLDNNQANFTIYLDGAANVQMLMKTNLETKSFAITAANAGKRHVHLEGIFQAAAEFTVVLDDVTLKHEAFNARTITDPAPRIELGARDVEPRGKNHVTIDNFVVRVQAR